MRKQAFILGFGLLIVLTANAVQAQIRQTPQNTQSTTTSTGSEVRRKPEVASAPVAPAPNTVAAKYEGGLFGYSEKQKGTLNFDDANQRLIFRGKDNKELFGLPYKSLLVVYGDKRSARPTAATVASAIPAPYGANIPFAFIRTKNRYLILQFNDPDSQVSGTTSFKLDNKALLQSVIQTLGTKANLKPRGDAYYRPREDGGTL